MRSFLAFLIALLAPLSVSAHPHIWIEATLSYVVEDGKITALDVTWVFDDFYSMLVQEDFDGDRDGQLSQDELDALVGISAANLREFSFFTHVKIDGEKHHVWRVKEFYAEVTEDELVLYRFRVPLPEAVDPAETSLRVGLFDDSYYVDILMLESDVTLPADSGCAIAFEQDLSEPLYYGTYFPTYVDLACPGA